MMTLFDFILTAIVTLAGPSLPAETASRYAQDIVDAAAGDVEIAVALVATGDEEGLHFSPRIERCACKSKECDADPRSGKPRAFGMFQLHRYWLKGHSPQEVCESNKLSTQLAADALMFLRKTRGNIRIAVRLFNGAPADDPRIVRRWRVFDRLWADRRKMAA